MKGRPSRLVLIHPPLPANERHKKVLPLGLAYLASSVRKDIPDISVSILDAHILDLNLERAVEKARSLGNKDTIWGITYWTCQADFARELSLRLKEIFPESTVIHGGVHATIFPEEALESADCVVLHEGETTLAELVRCILDKKDFSGIQGIAFKTNGKLSKTPPRPFIEDLDSLPFPALDLLDMRRYDTPLHVVGGQRVPIIGSRGCPYQCIYCGSPFMWGRRVRWRSPENVLDEMAEIIERYNIRQFHFWDDNFLLNRAYVTGLCEGIARRGMKIRWTALTRASHVTGNADLMPLLAKAGCIGLEIGIESANPETFKEIEKDEDLKNILQVAQLHKKSGMYPLFTYMAFNPGETISGYYRQARFIDRIHEGLPMPDFWVHHFPFPLYIGQMCTPHAGTKLFREAPELGDVLTEGWSDYHHHRVNFIPRTLLDDIPVKNLPEIRGSDISLCLWAIHDSFWSDFCASVPEKIQSKSLAGFRDVIEAFWRSADGERSVRNISERISEECGIEKKEAMRFTAFLCLILGQLGAIKSKSEKGRIRPFSVVGEEKIPERFRIRVGTRNARQARNKVTLYVPCFNAEKTLARCLDSITAQTHPVDELIVVDDGSKDKTVEIARRYGAKIISMGKNAGLAAARNRAVREARNEFVAALDADCVAEPDWLQNLMSRIEESDAAGVCGKLLEENQTGLADRWRAVHMPQHWGDVTLVNPYFLFGADTVYRKSALMDLGLFDERYRTNFEDVDMGIRMAKAGKKFVYEPSAVACHLRTDRPISVMRSYYNWYSPNYPEPFSAGAVARRFLAYTKDVISMLNKDIRNGRHSFLPMDILLWIYRSCHDARRFISRGKGQDEKHT